MRRRSANGRVLGLRFNTPPNPDPLRDLAALFRARAGRATNFSNLSGSRPSMIFSSTVCRCSGRECWNTMPTPWLGDAMRAASPRHRRPARARRPHLAAGCPMMTCITVDFPGAVRADQAEDFARADLERDVLGRHQAAEAFRQTLHGQQRRGGCGGRRGRAPCITHVVYVSPRRRNSKPISPSAKNRMTSRAIPDTTKVLS